MFACLLFIIYWKLLFSINSGTIAGLVWKTGCRRIFNPSYFEFLFSSQPLHFCRYWLLVWALLCSHCEWFMKVANCSNIFVRKKNKTAPARYANPLWQTTFQDTPLPAHKLAEIHTFYQNSIPVLVLSFLKATLGLLICSFVSYGVT